MSMESSVAVMAGPATGKVLGALQAWAQTRTRAADFAMPLPADGGVAQYANVLYGEVNYLDIDEIKAVIRDAVEEPGWRFWDTVGLMVHETGAEGKPKFFLLGKDGSWT
jgi:hypothetical protein